MQARRDNEEPSPPSIEVGGCTYEAGDPGIADALADAIAGAYASRRRPRCLCRPGGVEMYVARLGDGYIVKRMPETGSDHAPDCPSFEPPPELSGLARALGSAIVENMASGETTLKLDFPLSRAQGQPPPQHRPGALGGSAAAASRRLSLRGLLHYLWDEAGLTQWKPGFSGRRSWAIVRQHLLRAAEQKVVGGLALAARLYIPETFTLDDIDAINRRRRDSWAAAVPRPDRPQQLMLVIGEVKGIAPTHRGYKATIKHIPDLGFAIGDELYNAVGRTFSRELEVWSASEDIRMVMGASFQLAAGGTPAIARLCLMPVTRQWLPVETVLEQQLVDQLVREQRSFRKLLRYDLGHGERLASVVITDSGLPMPTVFADAADAQVIPPRSGHQRP
ncbi:DUF1173 family protein [Roseateles sp.]|uniref:DUF1173 family protein n=1 Tax=Roseateles sp. TaxID=1971397 RepID=UPI0039ECF437